MKLRAALLALLIARLACAQELVVNGSFESPQASPGGIVWTESLPGWTVLAGTQVELQNSAHGAYDGSQLIELDSYLPSTIYQDLPTSPGTRYTISLAYRPRSEIYDNRISVNWNGATLQVLDGGSPDWTIYSWNVTATSATSRLELRDISAPDGLGGYMDRVSVIGEDTVHTITFQPSTGTYNDYQAVTLKTTTQGATIYYTLDGTEPTRSSPSIPNGAAVQISATGTHIRAFAVADGLFDSPPSDATYTLIVAPPHLSPRVGAVPTLVSIDSQTPDAQIYYSLDGSPPYLPYTSPLSITQPARLAAVATKPGMQRSDYAFGSYQLRGIVYVDLPDQPIFENDPLNLDINGDGVLDIYFSQQDFRAGCSGYFHENDTDFTGVTPILPVGETVSEASNLCFRDCSFWWCVPCNADIGTVFGDGPIFDLGGSGYIGIAVPTEDGPLYGWIGVSFVDGMFVPTDYAFSNLPGVPILTGDTGAPPPCPPVFYTQPRANSVTEGDPIELIAAAYGQNVSYQWFHNDLPLEDTGRITGARSRRLRIEPAARDDTGTYYVVASSDCGASTSLSVQIDVRWICSPLNGFALRPSAYSAGGAALPSGPGPLGSFTIEAWLWLDAHQPWTPVVAWFDAFTDSSLRLNLDINDSFGPYMEIRAYGEEMSLASTTRLPLNQWTHLAFTRDASGLGMIIQDGQITASGPVGDPFDGSYQYRTIGRDAWNQSTVLGRIDELRIWSVARSPSQIAAAMHTPVDPATPHLAALYRFDEGSGSVAHDLVGGDDATLDEGTLWKPTSVCCPTTILSNPSSLTAGLGFPASFTITTDSPAGTVQWLHNGSPLTDDDRIHGVNLPTLRIDSCLPADAGAYTARISGPCGTITSQPATLTPIHDCNANALPDQDDISRGDSQDCNADGIPDECQSTHAATETFDSADFAPWSLSGDASAALSCIRLTSLNESRIGVLSRPPLSPAPITDANFEFDFRTGGGSGADGFAFVLFDTLYWPTIPMFGEVGSGPHALTFRFDTFDNGNEGEQSIEIRLEGRTLVDYTPTFDLEDFRWHHVRIELRTDRVTMRLSNGASIETVCDSLPLPGLRPFVATYAFGGRTGGATNYHDIDNVTIQLLSPFDTDADGNPDSCDCIADFNHDGGVDGGDVESFFRAWETGELTADVNRDGGTDGGDVETFFRAWETGGC